MPDGRKSAEQDAEDRAQGAEAALRTISEHSTRNALAATAGNAAAIEEWAAARRKKDIEVVGGDDEDCESIDGSPVVLYFEWPHCGWECDYHAWVTEDGRAWGTNHGRLFELTMAELEEQQAQCCTWLAGTEAAIAKVREWKKEED